MTNFGQNVGTAAGALVPVNITALLPEPAKDATGLVDLSYMQFFSKYFGVVVVGKLYLLDADDNAFAHNFRSTFLYTGLDFNMTLDLFPFTAYGGSFIILPWEGAQFTVGVVDPAETAHNDMKQAFSTGVLVSAEGRVTIKPFGLVGHQLVGSGWSNKERIEIEQDPSNIFRQFARNQFPRLSDPGPILRRIMERFFPQLLVPTTSQGGLFADPLSEERRRWRDVGTIGKPSQTLCDA